MTSSKITSMSEYTVNRYRSGKKMAEGAKVMAANAHDALIKAKELFGDEPSCRGDTYEISEDFI